MKRIAFIGLGVMGYQIAGHIAKNNYQIKAYNRTRSVTKKWQEKYKKEIALTITEVVENAKIVFLCVSRDQDVKEIILGESGVISNLKKGGIIMDHSTTSANLAKNINRKCNQKGIEYIDAPVSGGEQGAIDGKLTLMVGGSEQALNKTKPILKCYSKAITYFGESGRGQYAKMANQICIAGILQGLSEAINFSQKAGIDIDLLTQALKQGAAQSWQLENRAKTMANNEFEFGFAVNLMRKDLSIVLKAAEELSVPLPLSALVDQYYKQIQNLGDGHLDTSSLIKIIK